MVVHQVGSMAQALEAREAGADALIVQGVEAGGHVYGRQPLEQILADVLAVVDVPVAAAGEIAAGETVAHLLSQGAQAAVLGTALLATKESFAHPYHKQRIAEATVQDTVLTEDFHINGPAHAAVRVLRNSVTNGAAYAGPSATNRRGRRASHLSVQYGLTAALHDRRFRGHGVVCGSGRGAYRQHSICGRAH
ncbi:nitronate monooxygenase [Comamonas sp.]|uniref:nitronate monooxygenase n=1 Tax=Comamonas sp. TaxID=34028 RepID=UPI003A94CBB5